MIFTWASGTHKGRIRDNNEDAVYPETAGQTSNTMVAAVADGMGGHVAGEVASRLAIEAAAGPPHLPVAERVARANELILDRVLERPELRGMGTTLTVVELHPDGSMVIGHVGDSRAYRLRGSSLEQLTNDHSVVAEYLRAGRIRPEDIAGHPQRSMLTRALGMQPGLKVDVIAGSVATGDRLLICSDGLNSMIDDEIIAELLRPGTPEEAVWALIEAANHAGGHDNVSVVVVDVGP